MAAVPRLEQQSLTGYHYTTNSNKKSSGKIISNKILIFGVIVDRILDLVILFLDHNPLPLYNFYIISWIFCRLLTISCGRVPDVSN